jgi:transcriptional regulator of met regulon
MKVGESGGEERSEYENARHVNKNIWNIADSILFEKYRKTDEGFVVKVIDVFIVIVVVDKAFNDRNQRMIVSAKDSRMKGVGVHGMNGAPVATCNRTREIADQAKNIIRELHFNRKYKYI